MAAYVRRDGRLRETLPFEPACLGRALSQCERRDRVREETERLAPDQEDCPYRESESTMAGSQRRMGTAAKAL